MALHQTLDILLSLRYLLFSWGEIIHIQQEACADFLPLLLSIFFHHPISLSLPLGQTSIFFLQLFFASSPSHCSFLSLPIAFTKLMFLTVASVIPSWFSLSLPSSFPPSFHLSLSFYPASFSSGLSNFTSRGSDWSWWKWRHAQRWAKSTTRLGSCSLPGKITRFERPTACEWLGTRSILPVLVSVIFFFHFSVIKVALFNISDELHDFFFLFRARRFLFVFLVQRTHWFQPLARKKKIQRKCVPLDKFRVDKYCPRQSQRKRQIARRKQQYYGDWWRR